MPRQVVTPPGHDGEVSDVEPTDASAPVYRYELLLSPSFDAVLDGSGTSVDASGAVRAALDAGRLLLQARGGAGKSMTLQRIADAAERFGVRVVRVWAVDWTNEASAGVLLDQATLLSTLSAVSDPPTSPTVFGDGHETLLLIDGLNEVRGSYVQEILAAVDLLASRYPQLGVVIADRLARRAVDASSWQLASLTPVPDSQVRKILGSAYDEDKASLYGNPFFLERARLHPLTAATHRDFLTAQLGLDGGTLRVLASAVNRAYRDHKDRLIDVAELELTVGPEAVRRLIEAGVLEPARERSRFVHHLVSDFLAALDLAEHPDRWRRDEFDSLTFTASSFDALAMLLDETDAANGDLLVRRVYDWNLYAAAYMVAEDETRLRRVSTEMRVALLAMLAERRFDRLQATAQQVTDALRLQRTGFAESLLRAGSLGEVVRLVAQVETTSTWFAEWRALFSRVDDEPSTEDVGLLLTDDSVLGWTVANVLKRVRLGGRAVADVLALLGSHGDATVRWRCAHVLGAVPTTGVADALLQRVRNDVDLWVQYGALRSLIELAARSEPELRERVFIQLGQTADAITNTPQLAREVERALHVTDAPAGWPEDAGLLVEQLWARGRSIAEQDRWRELSASLRLEPTAVS
jgi:hypothetical protein